MFFSAGEEETEMDSNYMFLCGVMWCKFGHESGASRRRDQNQYFFPYVWTNS
jgi:hypothetical protein